MMTHFKNIQIPIAKLGQFLFITSLMLLTACASPTMKPDQAKSVMTVGVVPLLPEDLSYQKIGITVFFNIAARQGAEKALKQSGRTVVQLEVDTHLLAKRVKSSVINFDSPAENIKNELLPLVDKYKLDAVVLILESIDLEHGINGIRMFLRAGIGSIDSAVVMPDVETLVVNKDIKMIGYRGGRSLHFAVKRADDAPWNYRLEENLSSATHLKISDMVQSAINESVADDITTIGF